MRTCTQCGEELSYESEFCPGCGAETDFYMKPAGFWIRVGAYILDGLILGAPFFILKMILGKINEAYIQSVTYILLVNIPGLIYKPLMESVWAATLGKMICKIRVLDEEGKKLSILKAYLRFFPFLLSSVSSVILSIWFYSQPDFTDPAFQQTLMRNPAFLLLLLIVLATVLFLFLDCLCVAFTPRKRAIHDMMAGSFCVKKPSAEQLRAARDISGPEEDQPGQQ